MIAIAFLFVRALCDYFKPRQQLEAEILVLRHQLNILQQRAPRRPHLRWADRALFVWLYQFAIISVGIFTAAPAKARRRHPTRYSKQPKAIDKQKNAGGKGGRRAPHPDMPRDLQYSASD